MFDLQSHSADLRADVVLSLASNATDPVTAAVVELEVDARLRVVSAPGREVGSIKAQGRDGQVIAVRRYDARWVSGNSVPVFLDAPAKVGTMAVRVLLEAGAGPFVLWWRVLSPGALTTSGAAWFGWNQHGRFLGVHNIEPQDIFGLRNMQWHSTEQAALRAHAELNHKQRLPRFRDFEP
jgi:hypothetical protein